MANFAGGAKCNCIRAWPSSEFSTARTDEHILFRNDAPGMQDFPKYISVSLKWQFVVGDEFLHPVSSDIDKMPSDIISATVIDTAMQQYILFATPTPPQGPGQIRLGQGSADVTPGMLVAKAHG